MDSGCKSALATRTENKRASRLDRHGLDELISIRIFLSSKLHLMNRLFLSLIIVLLGTTVLPGQTRKVSENERLLVSDVVLADGSKKELKLTVSLVDDMKEPSWASFQSGITYLNCEGQLENLTLRKRGVLKGPIPS